MLKNHEDTVSSPVETKAPSMSCPPVDSNTTGWVTMITIALKQQAPDSQEHHQGIGPNAYQQKKIREDVVSRALQRPIAILELFDHCLITDGGRVILVQLLATTTHTKCKEWS